MFLFNEILLLVSLCYADRRFDQLHKLVLPVLELCPCLVLGATAENGHHVFFFVGREAQGSRAGQCLIETGKRFAEPAPLQVISLLVGRTAAGKQRVLPAVHFALCEQVQGKRRAV